MINVRIQHKEVQKLSPRIAVVGVGGAGGNAVNNMISAGLEGCEFVICNTDAQAIEGSLCETRVQLGVTVTGGLGAGARPDVGRSAAEESLDDVMRHLEGSNMVFITAGMGGGTGTGAAPVVARACRDKGILTVGVVTKPFHFEGTTRMRMAEAGIEEMQQYVDTLIVIPNQNLFRVANEKTTFAEAVQGRLRRLSSTASGSGGVKKVTVSQTAVVIATVMPMASAAEASRSTNVRSGPGTSYRVVDQLFRGEDVNVRRCRSNSRAWTSGIRSGAAPARCSGASCPRSGRAAPSSGSAAAR